MMSLTHKNDSQPDRKRGTSPSNDCRLTLVDAGIEAMRFTVKPSQCDSLPTDLDRVVAGGTAGSNSEQQRRKASLSLQVTSSRPRSSDSYPSTMTSSTTDDRKSLLPLSRIPTTPIADAADDDVDVSEEDTTKSAMDKLLHRQREADVDHDRKLETRSKAESNANSMSLIFGGSNVVGMDGGGAVQLAMRGQQYAARLRRRLVFKDGNCNISSYNVTKWKRKYLADIFTTLVDMKWRYNVLLFTAAFVFSWLSFSIFWFLIAYVHGDTVHHDEEDWKSCANNVYDYPTALLFSIETQTTIGYGFRVIEPYCIPSFFVVMIQSCVGVFIQSLMTGLIFAKLSRPKKRAQTLLFSRNAVVCKRDMQYCLLFRVGDMRKSHIIGTSIRAVMVKDRHTKEGEVIPLCQSPLDVQTETSDNFVFLVWPVTVVHKIDSSSPLWDISAEQLLTERFEIVVILEGVVESTGGTTQVRTSYLPSEILWGHRLAPLMTYQKENGQYRIDYSQFHSVEPVKMPECSARRFASDSSSLVQLADDNDDQLGNFTAHAVRLPPSGSGRLNAIRKVKASIQRRRHRSSRHETPSIASTGNETLSAVVMDEMVVGGNNEDDDRVDARKTTVSNNEKCDSRINNNNNMSNSNYTNSFVRSISFA